MMTKSPPFPPTPTQACLPYAAEIHVHIHSSTSIHASLLATPARLCVSHARLVVTECSAKPEREREPDRHSWVLQSRAVRP